MAKDPAVLFYYSDFLTGTSFMTNEEVGIYIRLLCHQADKGRLTKKQVLSVCKANAIPESIKEKFIIDKDGLYYQQRMEEEKLKRSNYVESRRKSALSPKSVRKPYAKRIEDVNENINKDEIIIQSSNEPTLDEVKHYFESCGFIKENAENFYSYYKSQEWRTTSGISIKKNWQHKVIGWMNNQKQFGVKNGTKSSGTRRKDYVTKDEYESGLKNLYEGRT